MVYYWFIFLFFSEKKKIIIDFVASCLCILTLRHFVAVDLIFCQFLRLTVGVIAGVFKTNDVGFLVFMVEIGFANA